MSGRAQRPLVLHHVLRRLQVADEQHREPHQADPVLAVQARQIRPGRRRGRRERRQP
ncbi:hypothetical protein ABZ860_28795 [Microbispora sp. NPDC046973]|uniref:hypothetical protein n=1 Tax=Microbispora sp. NPDC046973 TaxID=3155022 RepID=UPI0033C070D0